MEVKELTEDSKVVSYDILDKENTDIQPIYCSDQINMLKDKKVIHFLNFLRTPKAFEEIKGFLRNIDYRITNKTIVQFLNNLIEAGLVIETGCRISQDQKKRVSIKKLFIRSARFYNILSNTEVVSLSSEETAFIREILFENDSFNEHDEEILKEFLERIINKRNELFFNLANCSVKKFLNDTNNIDWNRIQLLLETASWLLQFKSDKNSLEKLFKLFS